MLFTSGVLSVITLLSCDVMSKNRQSERRRRDPKYFPNYTDEVASTPWRKFPSVTFVEFFEHRVFKWKLTKDIQAVMRLEHSDGQVVEWGIDHQSDINDVIQDVLNSDPSCRICIATSKQTITITASPGEGEGEHVHSS